MFKDFKYEGEWFLPEKPDEKYHGTLTFSSADGASLDLKGSFMTPQGSAVKTDHYDIILGISEYGKRITLYNCLATGHSFHVPGPAAGSSAYYAHHVFVGAHFEEEKSIKFKTIYAHYQNLDEWIGETGIKLPDPRQNFDPHDFVVAYKRPQNIHVATLPKCDLSFVFGLEGLTYTIVQTEVRLTQRSCLKIEAQEALSYEELLSTAYTFQNLLSLAVMKPVGPTVISGTIERPNEKSVQVDIYFEPLYEGTDTKLVLPYRMLWRFCDVRDRSQEFFTTWFDVAEQLKPIYDLYFANVYRPAPYTDIRFLSYTQALEAYHRRRMENKEQLLKEFMDRKNRIFNMPFLEDDKKWLDEKLEYSYEPNLRSRLRDLLNKFSLPFKRYIKNKKSFVHRVGVTRNYLIHYDDKLKDQAASGETLYALSERLKILIEICLLNELGFSQEVIKERLEQYHLYGQLKPL